MPISPTNAKNMLLTSDYPLDKVIYLVEGSTAVSGFGFVDIDTPHGLPFTPLPMGSWSTDSTWDVSYELNSGPLTAGSLTYETSVSANSTNVRFSANNNTGSSVTLYYRIYALAPNSADDLDVSFTSNQDTSFILNTDLNYTKLFESSDFTEPSTGGAPVLRSFFHGLGYAPQVLLWKEVSSQVTPQNGTDVDFGDVVVEITSTSLNVTFTTFSSTKIYYRIYLDEQS